MRAEASVFFAVRILTGRREMTHGREMHVLSLYNSIVLDGREEGLIRGLLCDRSLADVSQASSI